MSNTITIVGNLTKPVELKFLNSGNAAARLSVAVNKKSNNPKYPDQTSFFDVDCMGALAENCANSLEVGARVIVTGELRQRSWETDKGEKRYVVEIKAYSIGPDLSWATAQVEKNAKKTPVFAAAVEEDPW